MAMQRPDIIKVIPSASRLVRSLRDLGYDFQQAVADLVDNSITAGATKISIDLEFDGPDSWLRIVDNGCGMGGAEITEAMRYGSSRTYGEEDLGRFGLGLKTASLSQCRRLAVAGRTDRSRQSLECRELDLDHVVDADRWEIFVREKHEADQRLVSPLEKGPGTVVLWQSLDRILGYKIPWGKKARSALEALVSQLDLHLGMTFQRFLAGSVTGRRKVQILINGRLVRPWDPFAIGEAATRVLPGINVDVETDEGVGLVRFQPYVLPPREQFSSEDAFHCLAGPRKWNAQQGFYIFRANRLIQSGGWCRMRALDEHLKLARAAIDFYPELDSAFAINVSKVRVVLPPQLRERLRGPVESLVREAQATYRAHASSDRERRCRPIGHTGGRVIPAAARKALEGAARRAGELGALRRIVRELRAHDPTNARNLGW